MTTAKIRSTYGRCPIPGASPATLEIRAWHCFTGQEREMVDAIGGTPHARVQLKHSCGMRVSLTEVSNWAYVQRQVAEHFGPVVDPDDMDRLRQELGAALAGAASAVADLKALETRGILLDRLAPMMARREADAAAAGLEAVRTQLAHHSSEQDDPREDRGVSWPCDVARALWPDAGEKRATPSTD